MKPKTRKALLIAAAILCAKVYAQPVPDYKIEKLSDQVYKLYYDAGGYPVKVLALNGPDGYLIVDSGEKQSGKILVDTLHYLFQSEPRYIINSHSHIEHLGGNFAFTSKPVIIGHENLRRQLTSGTHLFDEFDERTLPQITFCDSLTLYFNGEEIKLLAFPGAHDNSDLIIMFVKANIAFVGGLCNGHHFPSIDKVTGDVLEYPEITERIISRLPANVKIIPGHGEDCSITEFKEFHKMLINTIEIIKNEIENGKTAEQMKTEDILKDYASWEISYVSRNDWIDYVYSGLTRDKKQHDTRKTIYEPVYFAYRENGISGATEKYYNLKNNLPEEYIIDQFTLIVIGYKFFINGKQDEAKAFFELAIKEFPNGVNEGLAFYLLGELTLSSGNKEKAKEYFTKALEANPPENKAAEKLEELK